MNRGVSLAELLLPALPVYVHSIMEQITMQFKQTSLLAGLDSSLMTGPRLWKGAPCSVCAVQSAASIVTSLGLVGPRQFGLLSDVKEQVMQNIQEWNSLVHALEGVSITH